MDRVSVAPRVAESAPRQHHASANPEAANQLLDRIEVELDRLRRARPGLSERIRKASNILVAHLAGRPAMPVVRVRITASGKATFLFTSLTGNGATYVVSPQAWTCTCPAAHRYGGVCKHGIAAWVLQRVARPVEAEYQQVGRAS